MFGKLLGPEIQVMIKERDFAGLKAIFAEWPPADMAELIADLSPEDQVIVFRMLPHDLAASTFEYLRLEDQESLLQAMGKEEVVKIINEMSPDDRTALLEELPGTAVTKLLQLLRPGEFAKAKTLLGYPERSVGRLMTPDYIAVKDDWTVQQVLDHIRRVGKDSETINVVYVLDDQGRLVDDVRIREFLLKPLTAKVSEIRDHNFISLRARDSESEAIKDFRKYDRTALPVVDSEGKLLGIVTVDDILDVVEKEATEDIQKLGGSEALDEPYMTIALGHMIRKRAPWLVILFLSEMLTTTAMGFFEDEISRAVILALFLPLIISSGGNSGSQATTLIIRAMAIGEVRLRDWWRVMRREALTGLMLGGLLGTIGFLRITFWHFAFHSYGPYWPLIGLTILFSLIGVVMWGSLSGSMLPFVLRRCGLDPATSSAPFVATLVDVTGLIIYFTIAMLVLRTTLLAPSTAEISHLGMQRTTDAFHELMALDNKWDTKEIDYLTKSNKIIIYIEGAKEMAKHAKCAQCGAALKVVPTQPAQHWPYQKILDKDSEIVSHLPVLHCPKCGLDQKIEPAWEPKQKAAMLKKPGAGEGLLSESEILLVRGGI